MSSERQDQPYLHPVLSVDAMARRVLDLIAASAQPHVEDNVLTYRWGQHVRTDTGDNTTQFGLHGSSQAVMALSAAVRELGADSRYASVRDGGVRFLIRLAGQPKASDLRKTVKIAEFATALAEANVDQTIVATQLRLLLDGRVTETNTWDYDLLRDRQLRAHVLPSLYVVNALIAALSQDAQHQNRIETALGFCIDAIPAMPNDFKQRACLSYLGYTYARYEAKLGTTSALRPAVLELIHESGWQRDSLRQETMFEYQFPAKKGSDTHAYCRLQTGLLQCYTEFWAAAMGVSLPALTEGLPSRVRELHDAIENQNGSGFAKVESCSLVARMLFRFRQQVGNAAREAFQGTTAAEGRAISPVTLPSAARASTAPMDVENLPAKQLFHALTAGHVKKAIAVIVAVIAGVFWGGFGFSSYLSKHDLAAAEATVKRQGIENRALEVKVSLLSHLEAYRNAKERGDADAASKAAAALRLFVLEQSRAYRTSNSGSIGDREGLVVNDTGSGPVTVRVPYDGSIWTLPVEVQSPQTQRS